jgi:hypothetical protein
MLIKYLNDDNNLSNCVVYDPQTCPEIKDSTEIVTKSGESIPLKKIQKYILFQDNLVILFHEGQEQFFSAGSLINVPITLTSLHVISEPHERYFFDNYVFIQSIPRLYPDNEMILFLALLNSPAISTVIACQFDHESSQVSFFWENGFSCFKTDTPFSITIVKNFYFNVIGSLTNTVTILPIKYNDSLFSTFFVPSRIRDINFSQTEPTCLSLKTPHNIVIETSIPSSMFSLIQQKTSPDVKQSIEKQMRKLKQKKRLASFETGCVGVLLSGIVSYSIYYYFFKV